MFSFKFQSIIFEIFKTVQFSENSISLLDIYMCFDHPDNASINRKPGAGMFLKAKKEYKEAYEAGDPDKIVEAQSKLNKAQAEQFKVNDYKPRKRAEEPAPKKAEPAYTEVKQHQPTQEDKDWLANNDWFQKKGHEEMTGFAMGVHQKLLLESYLSSQELRCNIAHRHYKSRL